MNELSKVKIKFINSLAKKKYRDDYQCFIAEGDKLVSELSSTLHCQTVIATQDWSDRNMIVAEENIVVSEEQMKKISLLSTPTSVFAIFQKPARPELTDDYLKTHLTLMLDSVQDPGNLGTIVRLADWFGIHAIICSTSTADIYNPKTVQSTMGSLSKVNVIYTDLPSFLSRCKSLGVPLYGTFLNGENIYHSELTPNGVIIMGNEGNGISDLVSRFVDKRLLIPNFAHGNTVESLNVATATAIVCSEFLRRL